MAGELIWSRAALDDSEAIAAFIARDSQVQARRFVERLLDTCQRLLIQPALGSPPPESRRDGFMEYGFYNFRILCERQGDDLHLLAIVPFQSWNSATLSP